MAELPTERELGRGHRLARRRAIELTAVAFHAAWRDDPDGAADAWRQVDAECGPSGVWTGLQCLCDWMVAAHSKGHPTPVQVRIAFLADCGEANLNPAKVRPEVAWAARLITARAAMDRDAFQAALDAMPDDRIGDYVMELTLTVARTVRGIHQQTLPAPDDVLQAAIHGRTIG